MVVKSSRLLGGVVSRAGPFVAAGVVLVGDMTVSDLPNQPKEGLLAALLLSPNGCFTGLRDEELDPRGNLDCFEGSS